jgi:hypothetical protein
MSTRRLYGKPDDVSIADYEAEITEFLREGFLSHRYRMAHAEANA